LAHGYSTATVLKCYDLVKREAITVSASILVRAARAASGLNQSAFALRSGTAGSSISLIEHGKRDPTAATLESLLLAARRTVVTIPTVRADAAHIADQIATVLANAVPARTTSEVITTARAFRRFIQLADNLAAERGATRVGLTLTEPATTGSEHWDVAIAAICEYRLNAGSLPVPEWISARVGNPSAPWRPKTTVYNIPADLAQVPAEFLSRGILIEAATLESF
jgi:transcriptional regulator with XRE-family HTH domain